MIILLIGAYILVGVTHVVLMGETKHRALLTVCWPLLYVIAVSIVIDLGFNAAVDRLQGVRDDAE